MTDAEAKPLTITISGEAGRDTIGGAMIAAVMAMVDRNPHLTFERTTVRKNGEYIVEHRATFRVAS